MTIERFRTENIVVQCETLEEAKCFIDWCYENGFTEGIFVKMEDEIFVYSSSQHYPEEKLYEVITYKDFMKENKMTNLKCVASKGLINSGTMLCVGAHIIKYGCRCDDKECYECEFSNNVDLCVQTLLEEHKEPIKILDEVERRYLERVLRPFKDEVDYIEKQPSSGTEEEFIHFYIRNDFNFIFPNFKKQTMYKGMELYKPYTLDELGLFQD